jgi:DNA (cytosine-5)-methyltransferase 1
LSTDFAWTEQEIPNSIKIQIRYELNPDFWMIEASINNFFPNKSQYEINIFPSCHHEDWGLGTEQVKLCAQDLDRQVFTALWKYFEETLIKLTGKADLVQLSGYYQYNPRINGILTCDPSLKEDLFWQVVQSVVEGIGVAKQLPAKKLASQWGVKAQAVFNYLESLRRLGYEVRNNKTNPQISKGKYLIPYAFPTLMPKSVQLRKKLR